MESINIETVEKKYNKVKVLFLKSYFFIYQLHTKLRNLHLKKVLCIISILLVFSSLSYFSVFFLPSIENMALNLKSFIASKKTTDIQYTDVLPLISETEKNINKLRKKLIDKAPKTSYIVVNTYRNHFYLYKNGTLVRDGLCSTGSYIKLEGNGNQKWIFKTPRGEFKIRCKTLYPVWKKPDWAFVEEGLPIPSKNHSSRFEYGTLGDYALSLGDGYLIHGTLYQRFLGMPVTHGCVRLGDEDLKQVFITLINGSKVFIF